MDRRTFLKSTTLALAAVSSPVIAATPRPWWWRSGFVPSGPVRPWRAKICFEGMYPSKGETEIWGRSEWSLSPSSGAWTSSGWSPVTVLTRWEGLKLTMQDGWVEGGSPICLMDATQRLAVPHPDSEAGRIAFPVPEWVLARVPREVRA